MPLPLESTAFGAALVFGFRHGFDWDHIAALTDLTGSQRAARRALRLATVYALGHALMVLALGAIAIVFAGQVPDAADVWMERLVGLSLLALGVWIVWTTVRTRAAAPPRSRWMVVIGTVRGWIRRARGTKTVIIEHEHAHAHGHPLHEHEHERRDGASVPLDDGERARESGAVRTAHAHRHRHVLPVASDPFTTYTSWSSFGIGLLHGIGAETPTQVVLFAAAANATDTASSFGMLACFIIGLLGANTFVALASILGFRALGQSRVALGMLAAITAAFSFLVGAVLLFGRGDALPALLGG